MNMMLNSIVSHIQKHLRMMIPILGLNYSQIIFPFSRALIIQYPIFKHNHWIANQLSIIRSRGNLLEEKRIILLKIKKILLSETRANLR